MEEYEEHLKNVKDWIESTNSLLRANGQHDSAKSLHKHTDELQVRANADKCCVLALVALYRCSCPFLIVTDISKLPFSVNPLSEK